MVRPTGRGWWVLALAVLALVAGGWWRYPGLLALGGAFLILVGLDTASVVAAGRVSARRTISPLEVPRYAPCAAELSVRHDGRLVAVTADGVEPVGDGEVPVHVGWLRPGEQVEVDYEVPTRRRGRMRVGPLRLRRYGVAGLTARTELVGGQVDVRVLPRVLSVRAMPAGARRGHIGADERVARGGTDLIGLREYVEGDDLRRMHWAASARTGNLMVREDADPATAHLGVLLDDRAASYAGVTGDPAEAFEHAVEVAGSLVWAAASAGHPVRLRGIAGGLDVSYEGSVGGVAPPVPDLLTALADVSLVDDEAIASTVLTGDPDVLAVVTGTGADVAALALAAGRAQVGAVVALGAEPGLGSAGPVVLLRGQEAEELLGAWDRVVSGAVS